MTVAGLAETVVAEKWLAQLLEGDAALAALVGSNVYRAPAPDPLEDLTAGLLEDTAVTFQFLAGDDVTWPASSTGRMLARALYVVKAVGPRDAVDLAAVADRLEQLLDNAHDALDGTQVTTERAGTVNYPEVVTGRLYDHLGATWRLELT